MARTDTLQHFLTDVAEAIREKSGTEAPIEASTFDTAISNIPSGGGSNSVYRVQSYQEMDNLVPDDGDICIVDQGSGYYQLSPEFTYGNLSFVQNFTIPSNARSTQASVSYYLNSCSLTIDIDVSTNGGYINIYFDDIDSGDSYIIYYSSSDGEHYSFDAGSSDVPQDWNFLLNVPTPEFGYTNFDKELSSGYSVRDISDIDWIIKSIISAYSKVFIRAIFIYDSTLDEWMPFVTQTDGIRRSDYEWGQYLFFNNSSMDMAIPYSQGLKIPGTSNTTT